MGRSSSSPDRLWIGFGQEIGWTHPGIPTTQRQRQSSVGGKHDVLRLVSFNVCERHLGSDSIGNNCDAETNCFQLGSSGKRFHMRKINVNDVPEQERKSPKGKFGRFTKNISVALGREPASLDL